MVYYIHKFDPTFCKIRDGQELYFNKIPRSVETKIFEAGGHTRDFGPEDSFLMPASEFGMWWHITLTA